MHLRSIPSIGHTFYFVKGGEGKSPKRVCERLGQQADTAQGFWANPPQVDDLEQQSQGVCFDPLR